MKSTYPLSSRLIASCLKWISIIIIKTLRIEVTGVEALQEAAKKLEEGSGNPIIVAIWHNRLFLLPLFRTCFFPKGKKAPLTILISKSRDGDIPSLVAESFTDVSVIRIGHKTRHQSLLQMMEALQNKQLVVVTPDGPRGPRYKVKPGTVFSGRECHAFVFAMTWHAKHHIELKSWDRFQIPLPFSKVAVTIRSPITFDKEESLECGTHRLEEVLGAE